VALVSKRNVGSHRIRVADPFIGTLRRKVRHSLHIISSAAEHLV
jgi:hypothetical protein